MLDVLKPDKFEKENPKPDAAVAGDGEAAIPSSSQQKPSVIYESIKTSSMLATNVHAER